MTIYPSWERSPAPTTGRCAAYAATLRNPLRRSSTANICHELWEPSAVGGEIIGELHMRPLQPVRGTQDLLPEVARRHRQVTETARAIAELYGFAEIATPIFEFTEVFARPIGEYTDIVAKEMYTFADRGGDEVTLRPENTAGVVRAVISNGLAQSLPLKFFYSGPMFRYERPQKGRFRQFHQSGAELIGVGQPQADIEVIALGHRILHALGIGDRIVLELNTLGDLESRRAYRQELVSYFSARIT